MAVGPNAVEVPPSAACRRPEFHRICRIADVRSSGYVGELSDVPMTASAGEVPFCCAAVPCCGMVLDEGGRSCRLQPDRSRFRRFRLNWNEDCLMLKLSRKTQLALEAVIDIAFNARPEPVQAKEITSRQGVPQRYLEQVMQQLVRAGILKGVRGPRGG